MSQNFDNQLDETQPQKKKTNSGCCLPFGCGCGCLLLLLIGLGGPAPLIPFFFPTLFTSSGEHLPRVEQFSPEATNYSFYNTFLNRVCEFDISEDGF
ncbi:MAG: hypothetical protein ACRC2T_05055 [Thermoguttaceae bacterium]